MGTQHVNHCYGPVFNATVNITNVTVNSGAPHVEDRRQLVQGILAQVNENGLQEWLGQFLREQFAASGLIDLTDAAIYAVHTAVVARGK